MDDIDQSTKSNMTDMLVSAAKSIVGIAPFAGSLLAELVGIFIPNQRIDRLVKYIHELDRRLGSFEKDFLKKEFGKEDCADFLEEGFRQATRALSDDRRSYIASVIEKGLNSEHISYIESKHLLQLLEALNDAEIIWLRFYLEPTIGGDEEFRNKHKNVLEHVVATLGSSQHELDKSALQSSYQEHLERLGLIQAHYRTDSRTGMPEFDKLSGKPKVTYHDLTLLGRLLLRFIGLLKKEES